MNTSTQDSIVGSEWVKEYQKLNNSFNKKLIFRLGSDSGFFSEYNNMVLAILYCLKNNIKFVLNSNHSNFKLQEGWNDFFVSFCEENKSIVHKKFNLRSYQFVPSARNKLIANLYKKVNSVDYLTQDLWDEFRKKELENTLFNVPQLGLNNTSLLESTQIIIKALWRYSERSEGIVSSYVNSIKLPHQYVSMHIRSGDKILEQKLFSIEEYMQRANEINISKKAFVLTDDYSIIETISKNYPEWEFYTLCDPSERGYYHSDFKKQDKMFRYKQHLKLFANMDICANSNKFIGTFSSNPGMYLGMRIGASKCIGVDYNQWRIW